MDRPVFIVGAPRSGTTLLGALLSSHSLFDCGPETQFFQFLRTRDRHVLLHSTDRWPEVALDFLYRLNIHGELVCDLFQLRREELDAFLRNERPGVETALRALTELHALRHGKCRWIEKSPNHILHLDTLRSTFPEALILWIVRDPRDVALSIPKLPWGRKSYLQNLYLWQYWDNVGAANLSDDPRCLRIRYEDLVESPARELTRVCTFLGAPFEMQMLDTADASSRMRARCEVWKQDVSRGIDAGMAHRFRNRLKQEDIELAELICAEGMVRHAYVTEPTAIRTTVCSEFSGSIIDENEPLIRDLARARVKIECPRTPHSGALYPHSAGSAAEFASCGDLLFWRRPDLGTGRVQRAIRLLALCCVLALRVASGRSTWATDDALHSSHGGLLQGMWSRALKLCARRMESQVRERRGSKAEGEGIQCEAYVQV